MACVCAQQQQQLLLAFSCSHFLPAAFLSQVQSVQSYDIVRTQHDLTRPMIPSRLGIQQLAFFPHGERIRYLQRLSGRR